MVQRSADMAKQRAQFHSIEIALEAFRADFGDYPESEYTRRPDDLLVQSYCGAQKLAETLIGLDGFGFHPGSEFRSDGKADWDGDGTAEPLYKPDVDDYIDTDPTLSAEQKETAKKENLTVRKGPYLELETANAVTLGNLYKATFPLDAGRFVLCDMFGLVKNNATSKKTGMPILYYRANTSNFKHDPADYSAQPDENIYDYRDNQKIIDLTVLWERTVLNPMRSNNTELDGPSLFYKETLNPNFATPPMRPYRADSFILLSAGPDGEYGTADDVFNFNKEQ
jgi:hypothetical protein